MTPQREGLLYNRYMSTERTERYDELLKDLLEGRAHGTLSIDEENGLLDEMDGLWVEMTEEERKNLSSNTLQGR